MATAYGNVVQHWQCYMEAYVLSQTATQATVRCNCYFHSIAWGYDTAAIGVATVNGQSASTPSAAGSRKTAYSPSGGTVNQLFITKDVTVNKNASGFNVYCSASMQLVGGYHNGTSSCGANVWVPAITYSAPGAPSGLTVTRESDTKHVLKWTNPGSTTTKPVTGNNVYRHTDDGGTENLYSSGAVTTFTDGTTVAGHKYSYDVRATGPGGTGDMSNSVTVYTSPLAPELTVEKTTAGVKVTVTKEPKYHDGWDVERSTDMGKTWTAVTYTQDGLSFTDTKSPAGTVRYRVRATMTGIPGAWGETSDVVTICPPNPPTIGKLNNVYATGSGIVITWVPNHPDWTAQSAAQVDVVKDGASLIHDIAGATASYTIEDAANGAYQVRVRTKGQDASWGEWSAYKTFSVKTAPTLTIISPASGAVIDRLPLSVRWLTSDETGIVFQTVKLLDASGSVMATKSVAAPTTEVEFTGSDGFQNKSSYTLQITIRGGSGLESTTSEQFTTEWAHPDVPTVTVRTLDRAMASVTITAADTEPRAVSFDVVRILSDGSSLVMGTGMKDGEQFIDVLPPIGVEYWYSVTAYADTGAMVEFKQGALIDIDGMEAFNFGAAAEKCVYLGLNASDSESIEMTGTTFHFALGRDNAPLPTFYPDGDMDVTGTHSYVIYRKEDYLKLRELVRDPANAVCWYRSAYGRRARVYAKWNLSYASSNYSLFEVSANVTEVVWEDPE